MRTYNFKELVLSGEDVEAILSICIENSKKEGIKCFKILHGYGSHQKGGVILQELKRCLPSYKRQKIISDYFFGGVFCFSNERLTEVVFGCPEIAQDEDFNSQNPGITVVVL